MSTAARSVASAWAQYAPALAAWTMEHLVNRRDAFGHYRSMEARSGDDTAYADKSTLTLAKLQRHFEGRDVGDILGLYSTFRDEAGRCWCRWPAIDIDRHDEATDPARTLGAALAIHDRCVGLGLRPLLTDSNGAGGYHLAVPFERSIPARDAFRFGKWLRREWKELGLDADPEVFPKQESIPEGGYGNWLRLPGRHHTRDHWTRVWDGSAWLEGAAAIRAIVDTEGNSPALIPAEALADPSPPPRKARAKSADPVGDLALASRALEYLDPSMGYPEWLEVGMALTPLGRDGLYLWDRWSSESEKYREGLCDRKWRSFNGSGRTLGSLFHMAKPRGFEFPKGGTSANGNGRATVNPDNVRNSGGRAPRSDGGAEQAATAEAEPDHVRDRTDDLPEVVVTTDEFAVNDAAIRALSADDEVYCRGNFLVTVQRDAASSRLITRPPETPRIAAMPRASIRERLAKNARWAKWHKGRDGEFTKVPAHPPDWSTAAIEARGTWPGMRPLEGVIEAPVLLSDGSILDRPGYDERSGLLYEPNCEFPPIPARISKADAMAAAQALLDLIADFPFAVVRHEEADADEAGDGGMAHRAAYLAALLTPLARHAIPEACPLFLADANTAGSGKSKLCDIAAILATGRVAARTAYPDSDEEMRKQILAIALEGDRMMLIDNVETGTSLGFPSLDGVLTACTVKGRILGRSQMSREIPIYTVWYATGNNIGLRGDILRRIVVYRLESPEERPEERKDFRIKGDLLDHVRARRGELVVAALTVLRGYVLAGRPAADLTPMDYPAWCRVVRQAIHWAIGVDPCSTRRELIADDPETNLIRGLFEGWAELPNGTTGLTTAAAVKHLTNPDFADRFGTLREVLMEWSRDGAIPSPKSIGRYMKAFKGRVVDGKSLKAKVSNGTQSWRVVEAKPSGFEGFKGFDSQPTRETSTVEHPDTEDSVRGNGRKQTPQSNQTHQNGSVGREVYEL